MVFKMHFGRQVSEAEILIIFVLVPAFFRMQRNGVTLEPLNFPATQSILW